MKSAYARNLKRQYSDVYAVHIYIADRAFRIPDDLRRHSKDAIFRGLSEFFTYI